MSDFSASLARCTSPSQVSSLLTSHTSELNLEEETDFIWVVSTRFGADGNLLQTHGPSPSPSLLSSVLSTKIKPLFHHSPHPQIDSSTGRKLARPIDVGVGEEEPAWKECSDGITQVLEWVIANLTVRLPLCFLFSSSTQSLCRTQRCKPSGPFSSLHC